MLAKPRICFCEGTVYSAAPGTAAFAWASVNVFVDGFWESQTDVCVLDFGICLADFFGGRFSLFCCWSCHLPGCPFLQAFCHGFRLPFAALLSLSCVSCVSCDLFEVSLCDTNVSRAVRFFRGVCSLEFRPA